MGLLSQTLETGEWRQARFTVYFNEYKELNVGYNHSRDECVSDSVCGRLVLAPNGLTIFWSVADEKDGIIPDISVRLICSLHNMRQIVKLRRLPRHCPNPRLGFEDVQVASAGANVYHMRIHVHKDEIIEALNQPPIPNEQLATMSLSKRIVGLRQSLDPVYIDQHSKRNAAYILSAEMDIRLAESAQPLLQLFQQQVAISKTQRAYLNVKFTNLPIDALIKRNDVLVFEFSLFADRGKRNERKLVSFSREWKAYNTSHMQSSMPGQQQLLASNGAVFVYCKPATIATATAINREILQILSLAVKIPIENDPNRVINIAVDDDDDDDNVITNINGIPRSLRRGIVLSTSSSDVSAQQALQDLLATLPSAAVTSILNLMNAPVAPANANNNNANNANNNNDNVMMEID